MSSNQAVCDILKLEPLTYRTCAGLKRGGLPCYNPVAQASRESAWHILGTCEDLPSTSRRLRKRFRKAAGLLLCKRWHQDQWPDIANEWLDLWEENEDMNSRYYSDSDEQEATQHTSRATVRPSQQRVTDTNSLNRNESSYELLVRSILQSNISDDAKVAILQNAPATNGRNGSSAQGSPSSSSSSRASSSNDGSIRISRPTHLQIEPEQPQQRRPSLVVPAIHMAALDSNLPSPGLRASSSPARSMLTPTRPSSSPRSSSSSATQSPPSLTPSSASAATSPPLSPSTPLSSTAGDTTASVIDSNNTTDAIPLRDSHLECGICTEPYNSTHGTAYWECHQCQNRTHQLCQQQWSRASLDSGVAVSVRAVKCVYCRATVPPTV